LKPGRNPENGLEAPNGTVRGNPINTHDNRTLISAASRFLALDIDPAPKDTIDSVVFKDKVGGWSGSGADELETVNGNLPVDTEVTYEDLIL